MLSQSNAVCPICEQIDQVRKVSSIVSEGESHTQTQGMVPVRWSDQKTYWLPGQYNEYSVTMLAKRLKFPFERPQGFIEWVILFFGSMIFAGLGSVFFIALGKEFLLLYILGLLGLGAVGLSTVLGIIVLVNGSMKRDLDAGQQRYRKALLKYGELYYCYRDDIVFIPGESGFVSPEQMRAFLEE